LIYDDALLRVDGQRLRLAGVLVPDSGYFCDRVALPARCAPRAALALEAFVRHFVVCQSGRRLNDGTTEAVCRQRLSVTAEVDLGAWLIEQGWALAAPEAPPLYAALERLARQRRVGLWGTAADDVRRR
jgi:endonuclease YncB( thermonuclease family)